MIFGLMMLLCVTVNVNAKPVPGPWFPKWKIKISFYSTFKTHRSGCLEGFGLCFGTYIGFSTDNIPQREGFIPVGVGMDEDKEVLFLVVDAKFVENFEDGRLKEEFCDRKEVIFDEDIMLPAEVMSRLGIPAGTRLQNRYPLREVDGEYIIEIDLK